MRCPTLRKRHARIESASSAPRRSSTGGSNLRPEPTEKSTALGKRRSCSWYDTERGDSLIYVREGNLLVEVEFSRFYYGNVDRKVDDMSSVARAVLAQYE